MRRNEKFSGKKNLTSQVKARRMKIATSTSKMKSGVFWVFSHGSYNVVAELKRNGRLLSIY
jgi:hypothetical protein